MLQPVHTDAVEAAFDGTSGTLTTAGYVGGSTVAASAPLALPGLNWVVVAQLDTSEAFAPVNDFAIRLAITSAVLVIVVSILSVILAQFAVRPLRRLRDAARRIAAGEQGVQVEAGESDELVDVAAAFNDMSRSLETKAELLEQERQQNESSASQPHAEPRSRSDTKSGAHTIVEEHQEVTVLFADIVGFEEYGRAVDPEKSLDVLNEIFTRIRRSRREARGGAGAHHPAGLPRQLRARRAARRRRPADGRVRARDSSRSSRGSARSSDPRSRSARASMPAV